MIRVQSWSKYIRSRKHVLISNAKIFS